MAAPFYWDDIAREYVDAGGVPVLPEVIHESLGVVIEAQAERMGMLAEKLQADQIPLNRWAAEMRDACRQLHTANAALANGGWDTMTPANWGGTGPRIAKQYAYLDNFAKQLADGTQKMDSTFVNRAGLYALASRTSYEEYRRDKEKAAGMEEERLLLSPADHCQVTDKTPPGVPSCPQDAAREWVPIGTLVPIGSRICIVSCACSMEFRKKPH